MIYFGNMIGKKLASVALSSGKDEITFTYADGGSRSFGVAGDCCSTSWIEHLEMPGDVAGATIVSVDESAPVISDHAEHDEENGRDSGDSIEVYNTRFCTDRGDIVLEYRNRSNGCYGGNLVDLAP